MRDAGAQPGYSFYLNVIIINLVKTANSDEERNAPAMNAISSQYSDYFLK